MKSELSFSKFWSDEDGQSMVEYALIISLLAVAVLIVAFAMRDSTASLYSENVDKIVEAMSHTNT